MKVDVERIPESQVELTAEVEQETVEKYVQRAYRSLVNRLSIPGFRKGKAPRFVVERVVGKEALFQEGLELLLPDIYKQAVEEHKFEPIDRPEWDVVQTEPLVVKAKVPVRPTVELGNYRDIRLTREKPEVTDEQVNSVIEQMREQSSEWIPVERPAVMGDRVTVDIEANIKGEAILEGVGGQSLVKQEGEQLLNTVGTDYLLRPQTDVPFPGLTEQLVGLAPGQEKEFELTLPDSFPEAQHAGKTAAFHVKVHAVREKHVPELNDEFAKSMGEFSTVADLEKGVREELQHRTDQEAENRFADAVVQMAVDRSSVQIPKVMIDHEAEHSLDRSVERLQRQGVSFDHYLRTLGKTREQILDDMRPASEKQLKRALVLSEIASVENLDVLPEEIDAEIDRLVAGAVEQADKVRAALESDEFRDEMRFSIRQQKAVKFLTDLAEQEGTPEDGSSETEREPVAQGTVEEAAEGIKGEAASAQADETAGGQED